MSLTDDRVVHRCTCGWTGRWDEAFAHIVAAMHDHKDCRIIDAPATSVIHRRDSDGT